MMRPDEERLLTDFLRQAAPLAPAGLGKDIWEAVRGTGQRPPWSARLHAGAEMTASSVRWSRAAPLVVVLATLLIALLGAALAGALLRPAPVPNGRLVHSLVQPDLFAINVRDPDGSNPQVIGHGDCPTFVADHRLVWSGDLSPTATTVFLAHADGSAARELGHVAAAVAFAVSPDGQQVAWLRSVDEYVEEPDGLRTHIVELWVSDLEAGPARRLSTGTPGTVSADIAPVWSPDGRSMAFGTSDDPRQIDSALPPRTSVRVVDEDGHNERTISDRRGPVGGSLAWSPDGRYLAYGGEVDDSRPYPVGADAADLWVADVRSGVETNVTDQGAAVDRPAWSPDGRTLAYVSLVDRRLHVLPMDEGRPNGPARVREGLTPVHVVGWSPDGQSIVAVLGGPPWEEGALVLVRPTLRGPDHTLADGVVSCLPSWEGSLDE
jgi:dipeptidyl aminopeptidase/acylaminoacyl peptidase